MEKKGKEKEKEKNHGHAVCPRERPHHLSMSSMDG
jgi:hypothetical protein